MRVLLQRVSRASVEVDNQTVGEIGPGLLLLVGVREGDTASEVEFLARKVANLRIFEDNQGKMNVSLLERERPAALVVSQFTLYGDVRRGRRPSFIQAAAPEVARGLIDEFAKRLGELGVQTAAGEFGAHMMVSLVNDGPVTIWLDSSELSR